MIRIPFSADSETSPSGVSSSQGKRMTGEGGERLELRLGNLETKLERHARELKDRVTERVDRIESRVHRAISTLSGEKAEEDVKNVIEFSAGGKSAHHLPAASAISALNDLNATLKHTREHLDALRVSVEQMRRTIPGEGRNAPENCPPE